MKASSSVVPRGPAAAVVLSDAELFMLASEAGARFLLGVRDPFFGVLPGRVRASFEDARQRLIQRGIVEGSDDDALVVAAVGAQIDVVSFPDTVYMLTLTADEGFTRRSYYVRAAEAVELVWLRGESYVMRPLNGWDGIRSRVNELWSVADRPAAAFDAVSLPEAAIDAAREAIRNAPGGAAAVLGQLGVPADSAKELAATLFRPTMRSALIALQAAETDWRMGSLVVLNGPDGVCRLRPFERDGERWMEVIPQTGADILGEVTTLFRRYAPSPQFTSGSTVTAD